MADRSGSQPTTHTEAGGDIVLDRVGVTEPAARVGVVTNGRGDDGQDRDGDGLSDAYEDAHGTDSWNADSDGDGLSDGDERAYGTDAHNADSDGDGISDGKEVAYHSNPLSTDTDGDGFSDTTEYGWGFPGAASVPTPANATADDVDGDGVSNVVEKVVGTNPLADGSALTGGPGDAAVVREYYDAHKTGDVGHDLTLRQELHLAPTDAEENALLTQVGDRLFSPDVVARESANQILHAQYGDQAPQEHDPDYLAYQNDLSQATINRDEEAFKRSEEARGVTPTPEQLAEFHAPSQTQLYGIERTQQLLGDETPEDSALAALEAKAAENSAKALVDHDRAAFLAAAGAKGPTPQEQARFDNPTALDVLSAAHQTAVMGIPVPTDSYLGQATPQAIDTVLGTGNATPPSTSSTPTPTTKEAPTTATEHGAPEGSATVEHTYPTSTTSTPGPTIATPAPIEGTEVVVTDGAGTTLVTRSDGSSTAYGADGQVTYDSRAEHDATAAGGSSTDWKNYLTTPAKETTSASSTDTTTVTVEGPDGSSTSTTTPTTTTTQADDTTTTSDDSTTTGTKSDDSTSNDSTSTDDTSNDTETDDETTDGGEMRNPDEATTISGHTADVLGVIPQDSHFVGPGTVDGVNPDSGFGATIEGGVDPQKADPFGGVRDPSGQDPIAETGSVPTRLAVATPETVRPDLVEAHPTIEAPPDTGVSPYADTALAAQDHLTAGVDHLSVDHLSVDHLSVDHLSVDHLSVGLDVQAGLDAPDDGFGVPDDGLP